jgi:alpha-galactosidase
VAVFALGGDDATWFQRIAGMSPSGWRTLGGIATSFPVAAANAAGVDVAIIGADGAIWSGTLSSAGAWGGWTPRGGGFLSAPAIAVDHGIEYLFGIGLDRAMWVDRRSGPSWSGWSSLGGTFLLDPVAISTPDGLLVTGIGSDRRIYIQDLA